MLTVTNYSDGIMLTRNLNQQTKKAYMCVDYNETGLCSLSFTILNKISYNCFLTMNQIYSKKYDFLLSSPYIMLGISNK